MTSRVCAVVAALSATSTMIGCVEEPLALPPVAAPYRALANAELATVGSPGPQDQAFGEALSGFAHEVDRAHAFQGARADASISWSVLQLATILERMPAAEAEPSLRRAAEAIRKNEGGLESDDNAPIEPPAERTKRSLAIAATALLHLARGHYAATPEIAADARVFAASVAGIDPENDPGNRAAMLDALTRASRVLARIYAVNVAPTSGARP
jgi:hypothetical protein